MKCPKCNGTGIDDDRLICYKCEGTGEVEQTNEEWLNGLPIEQRADEIIGIVANIIGLCRYYNDEDVKKLIKWLEKEHNDNINKNGQ